MEDTPVAYYALVASSAPPTPTPQELVVSEFRDAPVMVRIAKAESSFNPNAKNSSSTATGLFQILVGTWEYYDCKGSRTDAPSNIACARKIYEDSGTLAWKSSRAVWENPI